MKWFLLISICILQACSNLPVNIKNHKVKRIHDKADRKFGEPSF